MTRPLYQHETDSSQDTDTDSETESESEPCESKPVKKSAGWSKEKCPPWKVGDVFAVSASTDDEGDDVFDQFVIRSLGVVAKQHNRKTLAAAHKQITFAQMGVVEAVHKGIQIRGNVMLAIIPETNSMNPVFPSAKDCRRIAGTDPLPKENWTTGKDGVERPIWPHDLYEATKKKLKKKKRDEDSAVEEPKKKKPKASSIAALALVDQPKKKNVAVQTPSSAAEDLLFEPASRDFNPAQQSFVSALRYVYSVTFNEDPQALKEVIQKEQTRVAALATGGPDVFPRALESASSENQVIMKEVAQNLFVAMATISPVWFNKLFPGLELTV